MSTTSSYMKAEMVPVWTRNDTAITVDQDHSENQVDSKIASVRVVEEALAAYFHQVTGWSMELLNRGTCAFSAKLALWPILSIPVRPWRFHAQPDCDWCNCCSPREGGWRTYSMEGGGEVIRFRYQPHICPCLCGPSEPICEIFIPQRTERIGWIKLSEDFAVGSTITDCITGAVFVITYSYNDPSVSMTLVISDMRNNPVVRCIATSAVASCIQDRYGGRHRTWTHFAMQYLPAVAYTSLSSRAILVVAFQMWILMQRQRSARASICMLMFSLPIFFGAAVLIVYSIIDIGMQSIERNRRNF